MFAAALPISLQSKKIQNYYSDIIEKELSSYVNSKISIGNFNYQLFNKLKLNDLYIEDQQHDTLLFVKKTYINVSLWQLFKGKVMFTAIEFDELNANVKQFKNGKTNVDFIINAFKQPKKEKNTNVIYKIDNFKIKNSAFRFRNFKNLPVLNSDRFNPADMYFTDLFVDLDLNLLKKDSINFDINEIAFKEKSGFVLQNLKTHIQGSNTGATISYINLELPNSKLNLSDITIKYDSLNKLQNFTQNIKFNIPVKKSNIFMSDLQAIVPELKRLNKDFELSADISGSVANLRIRNLEVKHDKTLFVNTDFEINGLPKISDAFIYTNIKDLSVNKSEIQDIISKISKKPFVLPKELNNLGIVRYKGNITGFMNNLVAYGNLKTDIGNISTDILLQFENNFKNVSYSGKLATNELKINKLVNSKDLGTLTMAISTTGSKKENNPLKGKIEGKISSIELKSYNYTDIILNGKYSDSGFDGKVSLNDPNIVADFTGIIDLSKKIPEFNFDLNASDINLHALNLTPKLKDFTFSFEAKTNITGNNPNNLNGKLSLDNIKLTNKNKTLNVNDLELTSRIANNYTNFIVQSDYLKANFAGQFTYNQVPSIINGILKRYLPSLASATNSSLNSNNFINIDLQLIDIGEITQMLELPFELRDTTSITGTVNNIKNKINLKGHIPYFRLNDMIFEKIVLNMNNDSKDLHLTSNGSLLLPKNVKANIYLNAGALNDSLSTNIGWLSTDTTVRNSGNISAITKLYSENGKIGADLKFNPSKVVFRDSTWTINNSVVNLNTDGTLKINDFRFESNKQFVHVDGYLSKLIGNNLDVKLNNIDLGFVMQNILKLKAIKIDGNVTGEATLVSKDQQPVIIANLDVINARLNDRSIGDARIKSKWDNVNSQIDIKANFIENLKDTIAYAEGIYAPKNDSLNILFDLKGLSISFLHKYFDGVVDNVEGKGYGKLRMLGPTKTMGFEGKTFIKDATMKVAVLNTTYNFSDSILMTRKTIEFDNITFFDAERNRGTINGKVRHNGLFAKMLYDVDIKATNLIGLDTHAKDNSFFYGKAYTTGKVKITGNDNECDIVVNVATEPKSRAYIQMGGASTASDNSFITFENKNADTIVTKVVDKGRFNTKVDLNIDVNSNADMQLIIDPKAGDVIAGHGNGSLRVQFDTFSDINLYGTYTIESGYYLFTLQSIVRKEFKIDNGSTISWTGDPFGGKINIRAIYPLTASLSNIIETSETRRSNVPVNCVLKLTDDLMTPTIKFDIDLPTADESLKQKVKNVINTEEMMNRQIAYLLAFNSFYNPSQISGANTAAFSSFISSTISAHLNNIIQKTIKSDMLSFGLDVQQTDLNDTQYKAQVMLQPNDRIIVNSNVGYRYDNYTQNPEDRYMIDIDFEYLLTESGKLRFKAYSHTIDRAQLKEAKTTQGMGFAYKEDFQNFREMFDYYWKALTFKLKSQTKLPKKNAEKN